MDIHEHQLENGLRVIIIPRPTSRTATVRFYIRAGSRYDGDLYGRAHLLEHLLFRGTACHSSSEIFAMIESQGGELNAQTTREYICLYANILDDQAKNALRVLNEIFSEPSFNNEILHKEKLIISEELVHAQNKPDTILDIFTKALWKNSSLGHPIIGYPASLSKITLEDITSFYRNQFVSHNSLLVICGNVDPGSMLEYVQDVCFDFPIGAETFPHALVKHEICESQLISQERETPQSHILIGVQTVGMKDQDRSAIKVIELVLGMGASGRLYQRLRTELNLVYHISTINSLLEDTGYFCIRAICDPDKVLTIQNEIFDIWDDICFNNISDEVLHNAKNYYRGTLYRHLETNAAIAGITGTEGLLSEVETIDDALERINRVTHDDISKVADQYFRPERSITAIIGRKV